MKKLATSQENQNRDNITHRCKKLLLWSYLTHGGCLAFTRRAIGNPYDVLLKRWIEEIYPNRHPLIIRSNTNKYFSSEEKSQAVRALCNQRGTVLKVAQKIGVNVSVLYNWKNGLIGDEAYKSMRKRIIAPTEKQQDALLDEINRLKQQVNQLQLERDIVVAH